MSLIDKVLLSVRSNGAIGTLRILRYTLRRDRLDRTYRQALPPQAPLEIGLLQDFQAQPGGGIFRFANASLEVCFLANDLVRTTWRPGTPPVPYALTPRDWGEVEVKQSETPRGYVLASQAVEILVQPDGAVTYYASNGTLLRHELPPKRQCVNQAPHSVPDSETLDSWTHQAHLAEDEQVYGLGLQAMPLNRRGHTYTLWNRDPGGSYGPGEQPLYMPIPIYLGLHAGGSYLVFYENSHLGTIRLDGSEGSSIAEASFEAGLLRMYFIPGPLDRALERYTELTGRAGIPPLWSLGYHQSRWGYKTEDDIRAVAGGFRQHNLPLSAIHLDIDYMKGFRVFSVDRLKFPNLRKLTQDLAEQDVRLVAIVDPGVKQDTAYSVYQQGREANAFCCLPGGETVSGLAWPGWTVFPDFTHPEVRRWWGQQYAMLLEQGIAGIWHDMNEPASFAGWKDMTLPLATLHEMEGQGGDHRQAHNLYALQMNRAAYEALQHLQPERRPWIVSRSGWAGQQRYAWNWTGDTETSWASLAMTIPSVVGLGLSGIPFSGPDIGGFSGNPDAELYRRWFQLATFMPFFRTHSSIGTDRREPWVYGEPTTGIIRQSLQLRYRLLPYLYTLAWEANQTGAPLVRPLFWKNEADERLWGVDDAFLLGDTLLVAPILGADATGREVQLPAGGWYDFWNGTLIQGGRKTWLETGQERIPLLARAGSLLPMHEAGRLTINIYAPEPGSGPGQFKFYSDAGDSEGASRIDQFTLHHGQTGLTLTWEADSRQEAFPFPYPNVNIQLHGISPARVWVDGVEAHPKQGTIQTGLFKQILCEV